MKKKQRMIINALFMIASSVFATGGSESESTVPEGDRPDTWIADRHIVGIAFVDDVGVNLPKDQINNPVARKIKELTGITFEWQYLGGESDREMLAATLASGDLPDVITYYLNNSSRPEFPILLKAAREGMFIDIAPYLKEADIYSKYFETGYLPIDTEKNIMFREEFDGAAYMAHLNIAREPGTGKNYVGGLFIQKDIAEALNINPREIETVDQFVDLLKKINAGNFKDKNGRPVTPLGPSVWGGIDRYDYMNPYLWGDQFDYFDVKDGKVFHILQTDYVYKMLEYTQMLLKEGLMHKEYFSIDSPRAYELALSGNSAIIADVHNYHEIHEVEDYLPITLDNVYGTQDIIKRLKSGYGGWSIPATTENPEEVVKFIDFLASREGKLLTRYGIEGEHYDIVDGKVIVKEEMLQLKEENTEALRNLGFSAAFSVGSGCWLSWTDSDDMADFGEFGYGDSVDPDSGKIPQSIYDYGFADKNVEYYDGLFPLAYLNDFGASDNLKQLLDSNEFATMMAEAFYQDSFEKGKKIIDAYAENAAKAGLSEFVAYLQKVYDNNPEMITFVYKK